MTSSLQWFYLRWLIMHFTQFTITYLLPYSQYPILNWLQISSSLHQLGLPRLHEGTPLFPGTPLLLLLGMAPTQPTNQSLPPAGLEPWNELRLQTALSEMYGQHTWIILDVLFYPHLKCHEFFRWKICFPSIEATPYWSNPHSYCKMLSAASGPTQYPRYFKTNVDKD